MRITAWVPEEAHAVKTDCSPKQLEPGGVGGRRLVMKFDGKRERERLFAAHRLGGRESQQRAQAFAPGIHAVAHGMTQHDGRCGALQVAAECLDDGRAPGREIRFERGHR